MWKALIRRWLKGFGARETTGSSRPRSAQRPPSFRCSLAVEMLERRDLPSLPDLIGFANSTYYFHVEETAPSWGSTIHVDFAYLNQGPGSTASSQTFNIALYLTTHSTINPSTDYLLAHLVNPQFTVPAYNQGN